MSDPSELYIKGNIPTGEIAWRSPSNIAVIKYWGKYGTQLPQNPSLSLTLSEAYTETNLNFQPRTDDQHGISLDFYLEGQKQPEFSDRVNKYFQGLTGELPYLNQFHFVIHSYNSFPHSAGIASSASGMSALALCICTLEDQLFGTLSDDAAFRQKASILARLGSGSACRSIYPHWALWGQTGLVSGATNEFAIPIKSGIHPLFGKIKDAILLIGLDTKKVSSSVGHQLMESNPYAVVRYEQAKKHLHQILEAMRNGDLSQFGQLIEQEALQLHSLMMCSNPSYILMKPQTLNILNLVREFRSTTGCHAYFTLDAGPNVHLLYPEDETTEVENFIRSVLVEYCHQGAWISDGIGEGPIQLV